MASERRCLPRAAATVAEDEQEFQETGVAMIAESAAQQLEDREAAFLVVRKLEELAQACGGLGHGCASCDFKEHQLPQRAENVFGQCCTVASALNGTSTVRNWPGARPLQTSSINRSSAGSRQQLSRNAG